MTTTRVDRRVAEYWTTGMKVCKGCNVEKPLSEYHFCTNPNGRRRTPRTYCKPCTILRHRKWVDENLHAKLSIAESSRKWRANNPQKRSEMNRAREARKRNQFVEHVDIIVLYERDQGICGICRELVSAEEASMDHVIPISKGGEHSYANTQTSHPLCNMRKSAKILEGVTY